MDTSLSLQLQQAWLLHRISKIPPAPPSPAPPPLSDVLPSSPNPWSSRFSDPSLNPSSPDFYWSDFSEVCDSGTPPLRPPTSSSSSYGDNLPSPWADQEVSASSDDVSFIPSSDSSAALASARRVSKSPDSFVPAGAPPSSEAVSGVESLDSNGVPNGTSVSNFSNFADDVIMDNDMMEYISEMLMDEQMEDFKCMEQDCSAYQATVNGMEDRKGMEEERSTYQAIVDGFYEILDGNSPPPSSCAERTSDSSTVFEPEDELSWIENIFVADPSSNEQTLASIPSISTRSSSLQQDSKPSLRGSSSSGKQSAQDSSSYSSGSLADGAWGSGSNFEEDSVLTRSYPISTMANGSAEISWPNSGVQAAREVVYPTVSLPQFDSRVGSSLHAELQSQILPRINAGDGKFRRVKSEDQDHHAALHPQMNGNADIYSEYRRVHSDKLHDKPRHARNLTSRVGQRSDRDLVRESEEPRLTSDENLSFVKNKDLNAEKHSKIYSHWSPHDESIKEKMKARSTGAYVKRADKPEAVDLRGLLVSCAQAVAANDLRKASDFLEDIKQHASPYGSAGQRLAHHFAVALVARISGNGARLYTALSSNRPSAATMLKAFHQFVEVCPYAMISHYFANTSILKAAEGASRLHIVDYGILYGVQWPSLISALADREGGPPFLRITGIEFPQPGLNPSERVELTGKRLSEYAKHYNVPFEYRALACQWEDVEPAHLNLMQGEVLAVNSIHRLHHLLDESVVASSPRRKVLSRMHSLNPDILVVAVLNAGYNAPFFVSRFREALYHYSSKFDMIDTTVPGDNPERLMLEKEVMGRDILNVVACEGHERVERPETYRQWQSRFERAGFKQMPLNTSFVIKARALVKGFYHKDFGVDEDSKWLLLGWKGRIVDGLSAWRPNPTSIRK